MLKFRQIIKPGQSGRDVKAVKLAYRHIHVHGSDTMDWKSKFAGEAFVHVTHHFQMAHGLKADGVYGKMTHKKLTDHRAFTAYARWLYRTAIIRKAPEPPAVKMSAQTAARTLLNLHTQGKYHADNSGDLYDLQRTAAGLAVWSPRGYWVHIDKRPLEAVVWLIEEHGFEIGTFAICSDHHTLDGPHGHNGGLAIDISSINGVQVGSQVGRENTLKIAELLHSRMPTELKPWQLICGGYGYMYDSAIAALTIPSYGFYGSATMRAHENHIHLGYY